MTRLLSAYAGRLNTVEVNYTFRSSVSASLAAGWLAQAPAPFRFAFKAPQSITHVRRLRNAGPQARQFGESLAPFAEAGQLGPVLFQLPPNLRADTGLLSAFLGEISDAGLRTAWEFRNASWFTDATYGVLETAGAALCAAESDEIVSPDLALVPGLRVYRLRRSHYSRHDLAARAESFAKVAGEGADVYAFFKHEEAPDGPLRAAGVLRRVPAALRG